MTNIKTAILLGASLTLLSAAPAMAASIQDDIQSCREAMITQGHTDMDTVRLRYVRKKGNNRARTLTVKVISYEGAPSYEVTCRLERTQVVALNKNGQTLFAKKK